MKKFFVGLVVYLLVGVLVTMAYINHGAGRHMGYAGIVLIPAGPFVWPLYVVSMISHDVEQWQKRRQKDAYNRNAYAEAMAACPKGLEPACERQYASVYRQDGKNRFTPEQAEQSLLEFVMAGKLPDEEEERERYMDMDRLCTIEKTRPLLARADSAMTRGGAVPASASLFAARRMLYDLQERLATLRKARNPEDTFARREATPEFARQAVDDVAGVSASFERWYAQNPSPRLYIRLAFLWENCAEAIEGREDMEADYQAARARAYAWYEKAALESPDIPDVQEGLYAVLRYKGSWTAARPVFAACLQTLDQGRVPGRQGREYDWFNRADLKDFYVSREAGKIPEWLWDQPMDLLFAVFWPLAENADERRDMARHLLPVIANFPKRLSMDPSEGWRRLAYDMYLHTRDEKWLDLWAELYEKYCPDLHADRLFFQAERAFITGDTAMAEKLLQKHFREREDGGLHALSREFTLSNYGNFSHNSPVEDPGYEDLPVWPATRESWAFRHLVDTYWRERLERQEAAKAENSAGR